MPRVSARIAALKSKVARGGRLSAAEQREVAGIMTGLQRAWITLTPRGLRFPSSVRGLAAQGMSVFLISVRLVKVRVLLAVTGFLRASIARLSSMRVSIALS